MLNVSITTEYITWQIQIILTLLLRLTIVFILCRGGGTTLFSMLRASKGLTQPWLLPSCRTQRMWSMSQKQGALLRKGKLEQRACAPA